MIFSKKNKILAIYCHPDDPELVCYGTLRRLRKSGCDINVLILSKGENSPASNQIDRTKFSKKALKKITNNIIFEDLPDGQINFDKKSISLVDTYLKKIKPNIVITHYSNIDGSSSHQDHHNTRLIASNAARRASSVDYLLLSEPEYNIRDFIPNFYVNITPYFAEKMKVLKFHKNENLKYYFQRKYFINKSNWWSMQIEHPNKKPKKYFETFKIIFAKE